MAWGEFKCKKCSFGGHSYTISQDGETVTCNKCGTVYNTSEFFGGSPSGSKRLLSPEEKQAREDKKIWIFTRILMVILAYLTYKYCN